MHSKKSPVGLLCAATVCLAAGATAQTIVAKQSDSRPAFAAPRVRLKFPVRPHPSAAPVFLSPAAALNGPVPPENPHSATWGRPQRRADDVVYDNLEMGGFAYANQPRSNLLDDFDLPDGLTAAGAGVRITGILLKVVNDDTVPHDLHIVITFWDAVDENAVSATQVVPSGEIAAYSVDRPGANGASQIPPSATGTLISLSVPAANPLVLTHDISSGKPPYGIQVTFYSDAAHTAPETHETVVFGGHGTHIGSSRDGYWRDRNGDDIFTGEEFRTFGGFPNLANFQMQLTGTAPGSIAAANISGQIALDGLPDTAIPQHLTFTFHSQTGKGDVSVDGYIAVTDEVDANGKPFFDSNGNKITAAAYEIDDLPVDTYVLNVKSDTYLAKNIPLTVGKTNVPNVDAELTTAGDANNDNVIDIGDFGALVNNYGNAYSLALTPPYAPNDLAIIQADFNGDGVIDIGDFGILVNNYNAQGDK